MGAPSGEISGSGTISDKHRSMGSSSGEHTCKGSSSGEHISIGSSSGENISIGSSSGEHTLMGSSSGEHSGMGAFFRVLAGWDTPCDILALLDEDMCGSSTLVLSRWALRRDGLCGVPVCMDDP